MKTFFVCAVTFLVASMVSAADTLDIYVVDTEGGKAVILLTPDGEAMLVDAGYPSQDDRDTNRIVDVAQAAGIRQFDYVVATHYDADHSGNVPRKDRNDNAGSIGLLYEFGKFRMLDLADLLSPIEYDLVCPKNLIGIVDMFMVSHHGLNVSNSKFLVHALRPKVALMNNGSCKGGESETLDILKNSPGLQDLWQLHYSNAGGQKNAPEDFIANPKEPCEAKLIKVTVQRNGTFTVTNTWNTFSKTYKPHTQEKQRQ